MLVFETVHNNRRNIEVRQRRATGKSRAKSGNPSLFSIDILSDDFISKRFKKKVKLDDSSRYSICPILLREAGTLGLDRLEALQPGIDVEHVRRP